MTVEPGRQSPIVTPGHDCVHHWLARHAVDRPQAIAAEYDGRQMTYSQLRGRAGALAQRLRRAGVGPEDLVGLAVPKSLEMLVGLMGLLEAGGAYLPLDLGGPPERVGFMVHDAEPRFVLATKDAAGSLAGGSFETVVLDDVVGAAPASAASASASVPPATVVGPGNLAYAIYTSGSTGRPKAVLLEHAGLLNMALDHRETFGVEPGSRVLAHASLVFDASVSDIFMTLVAGATLCLASPRALIPGPDLLDTLRRRRVTHVLLPPSLLAVLDDADLPDLEVLIAGGERCSASLVERWGGGRRFFNAYGPTETTVTAAIWRCRGEEGDPPIGSPRANAVCHVVDDDLHPVDGDEEGELVVGGVGLARGYLDRSGLTAERFVPDPFSGVPGARLYRTGDRVCRRRDGALVFLGRRDRQIKIRGVRIELGEIEARLRALPGVAEAAVATREGTLSEIRLVAFYRPAPGVKTSPIELRRGLARSLPAHMLPARLVELSKFPLTPSGKLDYAALPLPAGVGQLEIPAKEPERGQLVRIWAEVLGLERVGLDEHFVELGGDSLASVEIARRATAVGMALTPQMILDHPTLRELARHLLSSRPGAARRRSR